MEYKNQIMQPSAAGLGNVGSYQVSGYPWISGSHIKPAFVQRMAFPHVAKSVTVINTGSSDTNYIRVQFHSGTAAINPITVNGETGQKTYVAGSQVNAGFHYVRIPGQSGSITFHTKCKEIYIANAGAATGYVVIASLTGIPASRMWYLTGSGIDSITDI